MKMLIVIALTLIVGFHSSGREPGAATGDQRQAAGERHAVGSGLAPVAIASIPVVFKDEQPATSFATIDIFIDPKGKSLGAYQFEVTVNHGTFTVVGIEGGDHAAFDHGRPPYFDRIAKQQQTDRLIVAEYARPELDADQLPTESIRVVTVHFAILEHAVGLGPQELQLTLTAAGNAAGQPIDAIATYQLRKPERPESE